VRSLQHRNPFGPQMPRSGMWKKGESLGTGAFGSVFLGLNCETGTCARALVMRMRGLPHQEAA
jgi:hypothetical protein